MLSVAEFDIKKEAAWAISNATSGGSADQVGAAAALVLWCPVACRIAFVTSVQPDCCCIAALAFTLPESVHSQGAGLCVSSRCICKCYRAAVTELCSVLGFAVGCISMFVCA